MRCPSLDHLADYLRGLVVGTERATITDHLSSECPHCLQNQQWLLEVKRIAPLDDSFEFPEMITAHIVAWMPKKPVRTPLRTLIAQLLFDSFAPQPLAEVREAAVSNAQADAFAARQLLYQVEGFDVDVRLEKSEDAHSYELIGQILQQNDAATPLAGHTVQLWEQEQNPLLASTDEEGLFRFTGLLPETYQLRIMLPQAVIEIAEIVIGEG